MSLFVSLCVSVCVCVCPFVSVSLTLSVGVALHSRQLTLVAVEFGRLGKHLVSIPVVVEIDGLWVSNTWGLLEGDLWGVRVGGRTVINLETRYWFNDSNNSNANAEDDNDSSDNSNDTPCLVNIYGENKNEVANDYRFIVIIILLTPLFDIIIIIIIILR